MLKHLILGALKYRPMTGYDLKQFMDGSTAHFWHAKQSQIYTTLKTLETEGLVTSELITQETRPDRRVYALTGQGRQELSSWLREITVGPIPPKEPLLLKLFFSAEVEKETLLLQLRLQRDMHQKSLETYRTESAALIAQVVAQAPHLHKDALLWEATRRSGEMIEETILRWIDETIAMIEQHF